MKKTKRPWRDSEVAQLIELREEIEAARRARKEAENRMSPAAALLGDPPPGFSALDRIAISAGSVNR